MSQYLNEGWQAISAEALPTVSSSTQIFVNAPTDCQRVLLTLRTAGLTMRFDAGAATAGANGHDYPIVASAGTTYEFDLTYDQARSVRAIQNGGTATGYITYFRRGN